MIQDLVTNYSVTNIVESSSGNLGLSLGYFAKKVNINFFCLVDPTVPESKIQKLRDYDINYYSVPLSGKADYRTARIDYAKKLDMRKDWIWTNQYSNPANARGHYLTTAPELYEQMDNNIDFFVCSVGSGGTISGVGKYLKERNKNIIIVAVEPKGSTIFGGIEAPYLTAGAGLLGPSGLIKQNWELIDYAVKVSDDDAIRTSIEFEKMEKESVGITTGSVLYVASCLSELFPNHRIACISPDGGENYKHIYDGYVKKEKKALEIVSLRNKAKIKICNN